MCARAKIVGLSRDLAVARWRWNVETLCVLYLKRIYCTRGWYDLNG